MLNLKRAKKHYSSMKPKPSKPTAQKSLNHSQLQFSSFGADPFYLPKSKNNSHPSKLTHNSKKTRNSISTVDHKRQNPENPEKRLHSTKKNHPKVKIEPFSYHNKENQCVQTKRLYQRFCDERTEIVRHKRLRNDLIENSLELFSLCQQNLKKRQEILKKLKEELNLSWKKLCEVLSSSKTGDPEIVEITIKSLISQRKLIEEQKSKISEIMELMKI